MRSPRRTPRLPFEFLERQLERREAADEAQAARRRGAARRRSQTKSAPTRGELEQRLAARLDAEGAWDAARDDVRELRFLAKLAEDIDEMHGGSRTS